MSNELIIAVVVVIAGSLVNVLTVLINKRYEYLKNQQELTTSTALKHWSKAVTYAYKMSKEKGPVPVDPLNKFMINAAFISKEFVGKNFEEKRVEKAIKKLKLINKAFDENNKPD